MPLCPIHKTQLLDTNDKIVQNNNGMIYHIPVFFCRACGRYYAIGLDNEHRPGIAKQYKNASIMYVPGFASIKNVGSRNNTKINVKNKLVNNKKKNSKKKTKSKSSNNGNTIIIHKFRSNKEAHNLVDKFNKIGFDYPQLILNDKSINEIVTKIFVSGIDQNCVIRNMSVLQTDENNDEFIFRKIQIYNTESSFLNAILPKNNYLTFDGKVKKGELWLEDVNIIENPVKRENDMSIRVNFTFNKIGSNCLYDLITVNNTKDMLNKTMSELKLWDDYLGWKEQLSL